MFGSPNVKAAEKPRTEVGPGDTVLVTHPSDLTQLMINTYSNAKSRDELIDIISKGVKNPKYVLRRLNEIEEDFKNQSVDDRKMASLGRELMGKSDFVDEVTELALKYGLYYGSKRR